jgi:hypothetical protein
VRFDPGVENALAARRKARNEEQENEAQRSLRRRHDVAQQLYDVYAALSTSRPPDPELADLVWAWVLDHPLDKPGGLLQLLQEFQEWHVERLGRERRERYDPRRRPREPPRPRLDTI